MQGLQPDTAMYSRGLMSVANAERLLPQLLEGERERVCVRACILYILVLHFAYTHTCLPEHVYVYMPYSLN